MKKLIFTLAVSVFCITGLYAQNEKVYDSVDELPEFPGGQKAMYEFVLSNLHYPKEARDSRIQGKVLIELVVETDGSISKTNVLKGLGYGCDDEVVRVMKAMPRWVPGRKDNLAVRATITLPVQFALSGKTSK